MRKLVSCAVIVIALHCGFVHALVPMPDPVDIEPIVQKLLAEDGVASDRFGYSVSVNANIALVGAPAFDNCNIVGESGRAAYIFIRSDDGTWIQHQKLTATDRAYGDQFGQSVSVFGDTALIGAYGDDDKGTDSGSVYVFIRAEDGTWNQQQKLTADDGTTNGWFGRSISIDGNIALIGATYNNDNDGEHPGFVYVFVRSEDGAWKQQAKLIAEDGMVGDYFGNYVSISGNTALIGAYAATGAIGLDGSGVQSGVAYVFVRSADGTWKQQAKLIADDGPGSYYNHDYFGRSVSISGDTILIGASGDDGKAGDTGSAYIFFRSANGIWKQQAKLIADDSVKLENFGSAVSLNGDTALIGAQGDKEKGDRSGAAYVFVRADDGTWTQQTKLIADDGAAGDLFGHSVSVDGDSILIGALFDDSQQGSAYIYSLTAADSNTDPLATGMTWGVNRYNSDHDISRVHCYGQIGPNRGPCNPYEGDTLCSVPLPVLCLKVDGLSRPPYELAHCPSCAMNDEYYNGWSEGTAKLTDPVPGNTFTSLSDANAYCAAQLGDGYRVAEHHDGRWVSGMDESHFYDSTWPSTTSSGGWGFYVPGQVPDDSRFWVHINDQDANCWDRSTVQNNNTAPLADAGENQSVVEGEEVCFDGGGSSDADNDELSYFWTLTEWPAGSSAVLDNPTVGNPCVIADLPGTYRVSLTVNDGTVDSVPSAAEVVVVSSLDAGKSSLQELLEAVKSLDPAVFSKSKKQGRLINKINRAIVQVDKDRYRKALRKIRSILKKTDGCAASGAPDKNDWIRDCVSQEEIYPLLKETIGYLENL